MFNIHFNNATFKDVTKMYDSEDYGVIQTTDEVDMSDHDTFIQTIGNYAIDNVSAQVSDGASTRTVLIGIPTVKPTGIYAIPKADSIPDPQDVSDMSFGKTPIITDINKVARVADMDHPTPVGTYYVDDLAYERLQWAIKK